jgi:hypothetical protein
VNDVLRQIHTFFSTRGLPASSYPDSHPPTPETAIFVKSRLKKWLFKLSLSRGILLLVAMKLLKLLNFLNFLNFLNLQGRPAPGALHCSTHFKLAIGLGNFKNSTVAPTWMANSSEEYFNLILSLQKLEPWGQSVLSVPVYYLLWWYSLSQFQMWTWTFHFKFASNSTFSSGFC